MARIYDRNSVVIAIAKELLTLRKATDADRRDTPDLIFEHDEVKSLWETLKGADQMIAGDALALYGDKLNAKGSYPELLIAAKHVEKTAQSGVEYIKNEAWAPRQLQTFKPALIQLEVGFYGQPQLCAYLVAPVAKARTGRQRIIPQVKRIDVDSPEGKAIAAQHAPRSQGIRRRG